jgi:hypothetical protein
MAKIDVTEMRDKAGEELEQLYTDLRTLQDEARAISEANAERAALHARIKQTKRIIAGKADEYGELARMVAVMSGGTNYRPQP